ncbi:adenylate/guanylate cyclase domain-containing protein [Priestia megaterium]|nr:adenylate/guanylate cyclase domain-containing protein [Priestia megaterium]
MPSITETGLNEIKEKIKHIFTSDMEVNDYTGDAVPSITDLPDKNKGLILTNCAILFVDIRSSTKLSDNSQAKSMAKIYRAFARAMSMCVYACGGSVRQIAGDRVMGVFMDDEQESSVMKALSAGRAIVTVVDQLFNPLCKANVNQKTIECGVGIDVGRVLTTSVGMEHEGENSRDLVWAGRIANVASKHTDLANGGEIFVTSRFYAKLPVSEKVDENGNECWQTHIRIKGNSMFQGYGITNYYVEQQDDEGSAEQRSASEVSSAFSEHKQMPEQIIDGINQGEIITNIVEGVRKQTSDLLERFENVINRERDLQEKEESYRQRKEELLKKEQELNQKEAELNVREERVKKEVEYQKNKASYEVKKAFFRENLNSYSLTEAVKQLEELKTLGGKLEKTTVEILDELYYWRVVSYFKDKDIGFAYKMIVEWFQSEPYITSPYKADVVYIIKKLEKEQDYLQAVKNFIKKYEPSAEVILELKEILQELNLERQIAEINPFFTH